MMKPKSLERDGRKAQKPLPAATPGPVPPLFRPLDWVALARGHGVEARRIADMAGFNAAFAEAMAQPGPRLIEVPC